MTAHDDGRRGDLFFEDGEELSVRWAELTQAGKWQVDTSTKPMRSADELKEIILQKILAHPVCPPGMGVQIRHTTGTDWEALAVSPAGQSIGYADCAQYILTVARALRSLHGLQQLTHTEISASAPIEWLSSVGTDAAAQIAASPRSSAAAIEAGPTNVYVPLTVTSPSAVAMAPEIAAAVDRRLSERPGEIGGAARLLSRAIADEIARLDASKPNEPGRLAQQNAFVDFLQSLAAGLDNLATLIDQAIAAGAFPEKPEPSLLASARETARSLSVAVFDGLERHRAYIADCSVHFGLFGAGFLFLQTVGVPGDFAAKVVAAIMGVKILGGSGRTGQKP
jgi:hypothetical protein